MTVRLCLAGGLLAAAVAIPAQAQNFDMMSNWAQGQMLNDNLQRNLSNATHGASRTAARPTAYGGSGRAAVRPALAPPAIAVTTRYRTDPAVSARVRRQFLAFIGAQSGPVAQAAAEKEFAAHDPLQIWAQLAAQDGMHPGDMADALTEYWVTNWLMANDLMEAPAARVQAVRRQVVGVIAENPMLARLNEAQRQEMGEVFVYNTILQAQVYKALKTSGDRPTLQRMSDAAVERFRREMHVELRSLTLTDRGFEAKV